MNTHNLIEVLKERSTLTNVGITFISGANNEDFLSYAELYDSSQRVLGFLQQKGCKPADELILQIDDNKTFVLVIWACILGRIIPIPLTPSHQDDRKKKFYNICEVLHKPHLITEEKIRKGLEKYAQTNQLTELFDKVNENYINVEEILSVDSPGNIMEVRPNDIAFIQFSSGSTGSPKGVVLTHENLITNIKAIANAAAYSSTDAMLSWMPLTHDMGLIGFHLNPLFCGMNHHLIPTNLFVRRPSLWFDKASEHKATILCSPNFGYKYIMKHCGEVENYNWDLSSVRLIYNGAEPISEQLCYDFLQWATSFGLQSQTMCPVYGLAEASLAVSISKLEDYIISYQVRRDTLNFGNKVIPTSLEKEGISFVNVGTAIDNCDVAIVDNEINLVEEEIIGHVVIKGKNVTSGYYNDAEKNKEVIQKGWLKTGDLGFLKDGCLYITGRNKDIIFVNGQNYYPHDIESIVQELEGIELNKIAIVGFFNPATQVEEIIAFVFHRGKPEKFVETALKIQSHINTRIGFAIDNILPVKNIPRTTSGKLQRFKLLQAYKNGDFTEIEAKLKELIQQHLKKTIQIILPQNETEKKLVEIWKQVLNTEQIGVTNNFFEIGGTSLKAAEIIMKIQSTFEVEIPFTALYEIQTIRALAEKIGQFNKKAYLPIAKVKEDSYYDVSSAQHRLFFAWKLDKNAIAYNIPVAFTIAGNLTLQKVQKTLNLLVSRHAVLRSSFQLFEVPKFSVKKHVEVVVQSIACEAEKVDETLKQLVKPFNLESDILMRCALLDIGKDKKVLYFDFHHIIMDGLSVQKFMEEFHQIYEEQSLEELPISYKDYVYWQRNNNSKNNFDTQEKFWRKLFENGIPTLELPTEHPRPALLDTKGKRVKFQFTETTSEALKELASQNGTTLHMFMFSIYKWLLAKLTGQTEMVIGIPVSGRTHNNLQHMLGMFVNNLPVLTKTDTKESFAASLKRDITLLKNCLENQEYPYALLVEKLDTNRNISRNPLFDTMFLFSPSEIDTKTKTYQLTQRFFDPGYSKFDLSVELFEEGAHLSYVVEYATALFDDNIASYVSSYLERMIAQVLENQHVLFSEISLLDAVGLKDRIEIFNDTTVNYSETATILSLFEKQVIINSDAVAIQTEHEFVTFKTLNDSAENFKQYLRQKKVSKGDVIAVSLPQSTELLQVIIGILKAGAIYLPISEETPEKRLQFILQDSNSKLLVCREPKELGTVACECILPNGSVMNIEEETTYKLPLLQEDPAYIIYTSGTTGNPKGVQVGHKAIANYLQWASKEYLNGEALTFPFFTSIDFDLTLTSIFLPLVSGNTIVIYNNDSEMPLKRVFSEQKSGIVKLTPSHIKVLINNKIQVASSVKKIIVGGEKLTPEIARDFLELCKHEVVIYNEYGPTEATIGCMIHQFEPFKDTTTVPIGKPIANAKIYVLDEFQKPVPKGVIGEIFIGGECLSMGYVNNKALTAEKFVSNPFRKGELMYASGDLAKIKPSGSIEYIGRRDAQVKINGHRIEKEEVKLALKSFKGILDVVITTATNNKGEIELYAYYIPDVETVGNINDTLLKTWLLNKIPHYMIPKYYVQIEAIPLTKNGKVDTEKLLELKQDYGEQNAVIISEVLSQKINKVYKLVMEAPEFDVQSNFYEFGGDSIKATQIVSKLREENIKVSPKEVLTYHTVSELTYYVENNQNWEENNTIHYEQGILKGTKEHSAIEKWFFNQNFTNPNFYNQSVLLTLQKPLAVEILQKTIKELITQHDGLRLNVAVESGKLFFNTKHLEHKITIEEYTINSIKELPEYCTKIKNTFDITSSLLIKAAVLNIKETSEQRLFITAHHLVVDGISWRILLEDFYRIYHSIEAATELKHIQKTASLSDFTTALKKQYNKEKLAQELPYWKTIAETSFQLPITATHAESTIANLAQMTMKVEPQTTHWLLKESANYKVDTHVILHTVLAKTIAEWCQTSTIKIELENHGRHLDTVDVSRTVGWFTVIHPVVFEVDGTLLQNLQSVKETLNNIPEYGLGYGFLKSETNKEDAVTTPIRFNYLGQFGSELNNDFFLLKQEATGAESDAKNQLTATIEINAMIISGELILQWNYNAQVCSKDTMDMLKALFQHYLHKITQELQKSEEPLFTPSDFNDLEISQNELDDLFS